MKPLRLLVVVLVACAASSAAPTGAEEPKPAPPADAARRGGGTQGGRDRTGGDGSERFHCLTSLRLPPPAPGNIPHVTRRGESSSNLPSL